MNLFNMLSKKVAAVILVFALSFSLCVPSFAMADVRENENNKELLLSNGIKISEDELNKILNSGEGFSVYKKSSANGLDTQNKIMSIGGSIPSRLIGEYELLILGLGMLTITVSRDSLRIGDKIVDAGGALFDTILSEVDNFVFAKQNPTGRRVKDVEKRLKEEGYEKAKNNGGSHQKWEKDGKSPVTVPNHGSKYEIPIGTLQNIWKQAGWK